MSNEIEGAVPYASAAVSFPGLLLGKCCRTVVEQLGYSYPLLWDRSTGGAVYVGAFSLIADDIPKGSHRDFALTAASVADSLGIVCADFLGIAIQQQLSLCRHRWNCSPQAGGANHTVPLV